MIASGFLELTYIIRLFAEFETGLRLFWPTARGTEPPGRTRDLVDGIAATRRIPFQELVNAHAVRFTLVGHRDYLSSVAISPDNRLIATGSGDNSARVWDISTGQPKFELRYDTLREILLDS